MVNRHIDPQASATSTPAIYPPSRYIGDMACILGGFASAGLHTSWSQSQLVLTLTRVNLSVIVVSPTRYCKTLTLTLTLPLTLTLTLPNRR